MSTAHRPGQPEGAAGKKPAVLARRLVPVLAVVAAIGLVLQFAKKPLASAGILTPARTYVAMAFTDPGALPVTFASGTAVAFRFSLFNHGSQAEEVRWAVRVVPSGEAPYQAVSSVDEVGPSRPAVVPVRLVLHGQWRKATVEVLAPGQHEAPLAFHVARQTNARDYAAPRAGTSGG